MKNEASPKYGTPIQCFQHPCSWACTKKVGGNTRSMWRAKSQHEEPINMETKWKRYLKTTTWVGVKHQCGRVEQFETIEL